MKSIYAGLWLATLLSLIGCTGKSTGLRGNYAFGGSTTVEPIINAAIPGFRERYPEVYISYDAQGSSVGIKGILSGTYSLGASSRDLKESEKSQGAQEIPIALDGVAVIVNSSIPIENLTLEQLNALYSGTITRWSELGGPDAPVVLFNRDEASGTRDCFHSLVIDPFDNSFTPEAAVVTSNGDMVAKIASTPYSIGYCGFGYIGSNPRTKAVSIDGIRPTPVNVQNGSYPVSRKLIMVTNGIPADGSISKTFIDYLLSEEGQAIIAEEKFIPLNP